MVTVVTIFSVFSLSPWERAGVRASDRTYPTQPPRTIFNKM
ncbi:hypothetical protein LEJE111609_02935 [Lelliottia jeotgali]